MRTGTFTYPGDRPEPFAQMNRAEFLKLYPRQPTEIRSAQSMDDLFNGGGELIAMIPISPNQVICDFCSSDPGDDIYVFGSRAICHNCAAKLILEYEDIK